MTQRGMPQLPLGCQATSGNFRILQRGDLWNHEEVLHAYAGRGDKCQVSEARHMRTNRALSKL